MSLPQASYGWMALTQFFMGIRYLPATIFIWQQTWQTIVTNNWNSLGAIWDNLPELLINVLQYWTLLIGVAIMVPFDSWINYDFLGIPASDKIAGGARESEVVKKSWVVMFSSVGIAMLYSAWAIFVDLFYGSLFSRTAKAKAQLWTARIGALSGIFYWFTVNSYDGGFF